MSEAPPLHILISGGDGDLARALQKELAGDIVHAPGRKEMDVRDEAQIEACFSRLKRLDVLIANAGLTRDGAVTSLTADDFNETVNVNLRGAFLCARAALKFMLRQRSGHIVFIGSRAARHGTRGQSAYAAAKAGIVGLAQSLAKEYGARNIRCNVVLPGFLETRMTAAIPPRRREEIHAEHMLGRFNTIGNAARFIAFLARLDHVSGQVFTLDSRMDRWT
ncbi:MAG TPA: SDR family NAD(P)-dependent oxidoreductase [Candidatus Methylacidiphilales bacterium]|nr:SDR family NAD(P)-dependent oxidoreductase [Candidatus Methylacidiphilales bacterium]